jgi:hypothetical protein
LLYKDCIKAEAGLNRESGGNSQWTCVDEANYNGIGLIIMLINEKELYKKQYDCKMISFHKNLTGSGIINSIL